MNAFNRLVMLIMALLLVAVPVFLLLVGLDIIRDEQVNELILYRPALDSLGGFLSVSEFDVATRTIVAIVGALVALVAGYLLLRELTFGRRISRSTLIDDVPGRETAITSGAVRQLAEAAAREVGATSPSCSLASEKRGYDVACDIQVPESQNFTELATRARNNIRSVLEEQQVPTANVEVTVQGTASQG